MNENYDSYDLKQLIAALEKIELDGEKFLNFPKALYTLALEIDNVLASLQSIAYEIDDIQKFLLALHVKNESS